jgi:hypothetical protein
MVNASNDPVEYLVNKKVMFDIPPGPRYEMSNLHSIKRPVTPLPELTEADSPGDQQE